MQTQLFAYQLFTPSEQSRQRHCDPGKSQVLCITSSAMSRPFHAAPLYTSSVASRPRPQGSSSNTPLCGVPLTPLPVCEATGVRATA